MRLRKVESFNFNQKSNLNLQNNIKSKILKQQIKALLCYLIKVMGKTNRVRLDFLYSVIKVNQKI